MTALFTAIFVDQWRSAKSHIPALIGVSVTALCLLIFGADKFIIPAMLLIAIALVLLRPILEEDAAK